MPEKLKIQKNTVQETLLLPLYGRVQAAKKYPEVFADEYSQKVMDSIELDESRAEMGESSYVIYGLRQKVSVDAIKKYLEIHPDATVVNIGCGMDILMPYIDNGRCRMVNLDFPDVIELRRQIIPARDRETCIAGDAMDFKWMDEIEAEPKKGFIAVSSGVFYYFRPEDVKKLFITLAQRFPGGAICFDAESKWATEQSNKEVKKLGNNGAEMYFGIDNPEKEIMPWSDLFISIYEYTVKDMSKWINPVSFGVKTFLKVGFRTGLFKFIRIDFKEVKA